TLTIPGTNENEAAKGDLDITQSLTINGAGACTTIINGGGLDRVLHVVAGSVTISGVTITRGDSGDAANAGGGILNAGTLTLNNSTVSRNTATANAIGGIFNDCSGGGKESDHFVATLTLNNSTVSGNTAVTYGGGIINASDKLLGCHGADVTLNNSTVTGNTAGAYGSGIAQY